MALPAGFVPPDALPLQQQIKLGIGVPPPAPLVPLKPLPTATLSLGFSAGVSIGDNLGLPSQISAGVAASFQPVIPGPLGLILALCGFKLPSFSFSLSFTIPLPFPIDLSFLLSLAISLKCDLANPISASVGFGGGRVASPVAELDAEFAVS